MAVGSRLGYQTTEVLVEEGHGIEVDEDFIRRHPSVPGPDYV
jgi:hypothetical protein